MGLGRHTSSLKPLVLAQEISLIADLWRSLGPLPTTTVLIDERADVVSLADNVNLVRAFEIAESMLAGQALLTPAFRGGHVDGPRRPAQEKADHDRDKVVTIPHWSDTFRYHGLTHKYTARVWDYPSELAQEGFERDDLSGCPS